MSTARLQHTDATAFDRLGVDMLLDGVAVRGFFSSAYAQAFEQPFGVSGSNPVAILPTASVPATPVGLTLVHAGTSYTITDPQPDGTGLTVLQLRRA